MSAVGGFVVVGPHGPIAIEPGVPDPTEPDEPDEPAGVVEDVELLPDYFGDGLGAKVPQLIESLQSLIVEMNPGSRGQGVTVNDARRHLVGSLLSVAPKTGQEGLFGGRPHRCREEPAVA